MRVARMSLGHGLLDWKTEWPLAETGRRKALKMPRASPVWVRVPQRPPRQYAC